MNTIDINRIRVPKCFKKHSPKKEKLDAIREYVAIYKQLDSPVVLDGDIIIDGYARYIVAKQYGYQSVPYITLEEKIGVDDSVELPVTCVTGKHLNNDKPYTWRVISGLEVNVGDLVRVCTSNNMYGHNQVVEVVDVFTSDDPAVLRHKLAISVVKKKSKKV